MRATALGLCLALCASGVARADDDDADFGFGLTPWFHMGPSWSVSGRDLPTADARTGVTIELNAQALFVFGPVGVGVTAGYFGTGGRVGETDDRVELTGFQVMPLLMFAPFERFALHAKAGYVFGAMNGSEVPAGALRFGGGLTVVIIRFAGGDIALSAEVTHTRLMAVESGPLEAFHATGGTLGFTMSVDPGVFD